MQEICKNIYITLKATVRKDSAGPAEVLFGANLAISLKVSRVAQVQPRTTADL